MKRNLTKRLLAVILSATMVLNLANEPVVTMAASKTVTASNQKKLNAALKNAEADTVVIKSSTKKTYKANEDNCEAKTLKVNAKNATLKNYTQFSKIQIGGSKNVFYEYAGNDTITFGGSQSKLIVGNKKNAGTITVTGTKNYVKINKGSKAKKLVFNKEDATNSVVINGALSEIKIKKKTNLTLTGITENQKLTCTAEGSEITSSVPLTATFTCSAKLVLNKGSEDSLITLEGDSVITVTNNTNKTIVIQTPNGEVTVEQGKTVSADKKNETSDNNSGSGGATSGGASNGGSYASNVLSGISLDIYDVTLSNEEEATKEVSVVTYNKSNASFGYIKSSDDVSVSLISADLPGQTLTEEGVASNPGRYYTISKDKITFLSKGLPEGVYKYQIKVADFTQTFSVTVTGSAQTAAKTVLLPYLGDDATSPCSDSTFDVCVTSEKDANKTVSFALYTQVGECNAVLLKEINDISDCEYDVYQSGVEYKSDKVEETPLKLTITSFDKNTRMVKKIKEGNYTILVTFEEDGKDTTYYNKMKIVDTQPKASLEQYSDTVNGSKLIDEFIDTDTTLNRYILDEYNNYVVPTYKLEAQASDLNYNLEPMLSVACNSFYLKYGLYQSCRVTLNGVTYNLGNARTKIDGVLGATTTMQGNAIRNSSTNYTKNYIEKASIKNLTVYLDVARWNENGELPLYVPYTFENANVAFSYTSNDDTSISMQYTIANKATDFSSLEKTNTYLSVNDKTGYYLYSKIMDAADCEITDYSSYMLKSQDPEILKVESTIASDTKASKVTPVSEGTATLVLCNATTKDEIKTINITVGDLDPSVYALKLDKNEVTLSNNNEVTDQETIEIDMTNYETGEVIKDYDPCAGSGLVALTLKSGTKDDCGALAESEITTIQSVIDNDLTTTENQAKVVYYEDEKLVIKGYTENILPAGTYEFELSMSGITTTLTVHIETVNLKGEVSYSFASTFNFDLNELKVQEVVKHPYVIQIVKKVNGKPVSYVTGAAITFSDSRLDSYYDPDTSVLEVFKTQKTGEDEYSETYNLTDMIPVTNSTITATFQDENLNQIQLTDNILITNSSPYGVNLNKESIDTATLADEYYRIIWNKYDALIAEKEADQAGSYDDYLNEEKELLAKYLISKLLKVKELKNGVHYWVNASKCEYEYQSDPETGVLTGLILTKAVIEPMYNNDFFNVDGKTIIITYPQTYEFNLNLPISFK